MCSDTLRGTLADFRARLVRTGKTGELARET